LDHRAAPRRAGNIAFNVSVVSVSSALRNAANRDYMAMTPVLTSAAGDDRQPAVLWIEASLLRGEFDESQAGSLYGSGLRSRLDDDRGLFFR
jgi:hypothetical protein